MNVITTRWLVARRPFRQPKFGETTRDVLRWSVTPYIATKKDQRIFGSTTYLSTLAGALAHARREQHRFYGRDETPAGISHRAFEGARG